jgi:hypothetical protein
MRLSIPSLAFVILSTALPAIAEDLTIVSKVTHDGGPAETSTSYISSDHVRMSQPDGNEAIVDLKSGQMSMLDGKKKTYYVITRQDIDAMAVKIQEQMNSPEMKKAQEQMKNLPPEIQQRMSGMFAVDVEKSGSTRTIAGYKCDNWTITIGQFSRTEECVTNELKFPLQAWDMYRGYADSMKNLMTAMGPMARSVATMQEQFKKMKGFSLASTTTMNVMGRKSASVSEVTAIKQGPIPASAWEIPAGYTKVDNPMMKAIARRGK